MLTISLDHQKEKGGGMEQNEGKFSMNLDKRDLWYYWNTKNQN